MFNNKYVDAINEIAGTFTPPGGPFQQLEFYAGLFEVTTSFLSYMLGDSIEHNSHTSSYLYDKVINKDSNEQVAILKSVITKQSTKHIWQDSYKSETIAERTLF